MSNACFESFKEHLHCAATVRQNLLSDFIRVFYCWETAYFAVITINLYHGSLILGGSILFHFKETTTKFLGSNDYVRISALILRIILNFPMKRKKSRT